MSQRNPKNPVSNFYWNDWINDPALKKCSYAAKGLWMDCLCLAATCVPYGHLADGALPHDAESLAKILPGNHPVAEIAALLAELIASGAASRSADGTIYSRRMVRDFHKAIIARKIGKKGGNPSLLKQSRKPRRDNREDNAEVNPNTSSLSLNTPKSPKGDFRSFEENENHHDPWFIRVKRFFERGFWLEEWGKTPNEPGCAASTAIIEHFRRKTA